MTSTFVETAMSIPVDPYYDKQYNARASVTDYDQSHACTAR